MQLYLCLVHISKHHITKVQFYRQCSICRLSWFVCLASVHRLALCMNLLLIMHLTYYSLYSHCIMKVYTVYNIMYELNGLLTLHSVSRCSQMSSIFRAWVLSSRHVQNFMLRLMSRTSLSHSLIAWQTSLTGKMVQVSLKTSSSLRFFQSKYHRSLRWVKKVLLLLECIGIITFLHPCLVLLGCASNVQ